MGRIEVNSADVPQNRRGTPFTTPEVARLVQEIRARRDIIYGTESQAAEPQKVRQAWEEIAEIISSLSNITRSAEQCRKRFNDIKRRGQKMVVTKKRGRPPKNRPKPLGASDILESNKFVEPEDLEFEPNDLEFDFPGVMEGMEGMDDDDPDYEPSPKKRDFKITKDIPLPLRPDSPSSGSNSPSPKPQVSSQSKLQAPSLPTPPSPSLPQPDVSPPPKPQVSSLPKPQAPSVSKPGSPSVSKPGTPSVSKPGAPSVPKPGGASVPKPGGASVPKPGGAAVPKPGGPSLSKPGTQSVSKPGAPSISKPQNPSNPSNPSKPKVVLVRKSVGSTDPGARPPHPRPRGDDKHPFLELQQAGFDMLKKELSGFRDSVMSLNTRLNHLEVALRPIGHIADSLSRIANAVERLTCPPE